MQRAPAAIDRDAIPSQVESTLHARRRPARLSSVRGPHSSSRFGPFGRAWRGPTLPARPATERSTAACPTGEEPMLARLILPAALRYAAAEFVLAPRATSRGPTARTKLAVA